MPSDSGAQTINKGPGDDIVVTGLGVISPLGHSVDDHFQYLLAGQSGVKRQESQQGELRYAWCGAQIDGFDPKSHVQPRKAIKVMCREIQLAFGASMQACRQAGIAAGLIDPDRIGTVFSGELILSDLTEVEDVVRHCSLAGEMNHSIWSVKAMDHMYPLWMLKSLPNMAACHVGIALDARGPNNTITTEGTSSLNAILEAINVIRRDKADVIVVGSSASRVNSLRLIQRFEQDFSRSIDEGSRACKPFDAKRDGTVPAEHSSSVVLERRSHAEGRGAKILATISSWASTFCQPNRDRWSGVSQSTESALRLLLERSRLQVEDIDHINACASGSVVGDRVEAQGIARVLPQTPVVSYKGALGDSISASGLLEWISSLQGMLEGKIASTTNCTEISQDCPIAVISGAQKERVTGSFIKLSNTPDGRCAGIVTRSD